MGAPTETVTVTGEGPLIENASTTSTYRMASLQFTELPQGARDFTSLLALSTGFRFTRDGMIQFNGLASGGNSVTVDGVDASANSESSSTAMFQNFNTIEGGEHGGDRRGGGLAGRGFRRGGPHLQRQH
ncbi:MAG: hypothetical protein ACP5U2_03605 [Bryobacteraceae bacterium]